MSLVEGATFNGKIDMDGTAEESPAKKPDARPAKAAVASQEPEAEAPKAEKKPARADKKSADAA